MSPYRTPPPVPVEPKEPWRLSRTAKLLLYVAVGLVVRLAHPGSLGWSLAVLGFVLLALVASYLTLAPRYAAWRATRIDRAADDAIAAFDRHGDC
jgi:membrane protein YdbS with pleckstrin-like domain